MPYSGAGELVATDIREQPDVLRRAVSVNAPALAQTRLLIDRSTLVRLIGIGSSKHSAGYGSQTLEVLSGKPAVVLPAPGAAVAYPRFATDQVAIVLSQSGETPTLLEAAARARDAGCPLVAVTNTPNSSLESIADVTLACAAGAERVVAATKSVMAQMILLRAISLPPSRSEVEELAEAVAHTVEGLDLSKVITDERAGGVVCGGFAAEWIADEIALKFAEMAGLPVVSESIVEYFHGPAGASTRTLAFLDPSDPNSEGMVGADGVSTVGASATYDVTTPSMPDASLDALVRLAAGHRILLEWAKWLGEDPDADRGLSKVTHTK